MGTLINVATILGGSLLGLLIRSRLPDRYVEVIFQALGLFTVFLGVKLGLETQQMLVLIPSLVLGALVGEWLRLEDRLQQLGEWLRRRIASRRHSDHRFAQGLVTAFLLFGIGPMSTLGALQEGLGQGSEVLLTKALLDGIASVALAAGLGLGVAFSALPVALYQGGLTLFAVALQPLITEAAIAELSAVGGIILIGLGLNLLKLAQLRVSNLLPGLLLAVILALVMN